MTLTSLVRQACGDWHYGRWLRLRHFQRVVAQLPCDLSTADILDAGCGTGVAALWLAARYPACHVLGVDADAAAIACCRRHAAARGVSNACFETLRLEEMSFDRRFTFAYVISVLEYVEQEAQAIVRLKRALRPGGIALVEVPDLWLGANPRFGLRRLVQGQGHPAGYVRAGYTLAHLHRVLAGGDLHVIGSRYTMAPPALFAHTVFELLRARHRRWYLALLPLLRVIGYTDGAWRWRRGGSLMMWAQRVDG